ncbi:MAG: hypothetical protein KDD33_04740 [Bdellovibrionales bacterium]|nr:hypothetical protein [Bdellovibrionales bacterium]
MRMYKQVVLSLASCGLMFAVFQNCSQHGFDASGNVEKTSTDNNNQLDIGSNSLSGELTSMSDQGVINGVVNDPDGGDSGVAIDFYVVQEDGGRIHIGDTVAFTPDSGGTGSGPEVLSFSFTVPFDHICRPVLVFADDGDDGIDVIQLPMSPGFQLWGVDGDPSHPCNDMTPPPNVEVISPEPESESGSQNVTLVGRCQPGAGSIVAMGDVPRVQTQCTSEGIFTLTVHLPNFMTMHHINVSQTSPDGMTAVDHIQIFLDKAAPPPPPPPTPTPGGDGGGGY